MGLQVRALVTGSEGFLGRHFVRALERRNIDVTGVDILNGDDALDFFRTTGRRFDLAFHCAAVVGGRHVIDRDPLKQVLNYALDAEYIHWCERTRPSVGVYFSSSAAYPICLQTRPGVRLAETQVVPGHAEEPDAGYGWGKLTGERLVTQARAAGVDMLVVRPFSGYGADQSLDYPFPSFVARAKARRDPFEIWGTGQQVRDWVHVDDIVAAVFAFIDAGETGPVNIGTGIGTSMIELAEQVCRQAGYRPTFAVRPTAPAGVQYRVCDPTRMARTYTPRVTLDEGVWRALHI